MKALQWGVRPEPQPEPGGDNHLLRGLAHTPMRIVELDDPSFIGPDWVLTRPRHAFAALATQDESGAIKVAFDMRRRKGSADASSRTLDRAAPA